MLNVWFCLQDFHKESHTLFASKAPLCGNFEKIHDHSVTEYLSEDNIYPRLPHIVPTFKCSTAARDCDMEDPSCSTYD